MHRFLAIVMLCAGGAFSAEEPPAATTAAVAAPKWYERFHLRGYTQVRYNRLGATNPALVSDQGDKSIGDRNGMFLRRARLIFSGDVGDHLSFYLQPDFASSPANGVLNFAQLRDLYADIFVDAAKEFRFRVGQSKVPFGFDNMQSSQNRLPLDRADATNSGVRDERDLGAFFYWAPTETRKLFKYLVDSGLKGSGDYGVVGLGIYNGQTANRPEANNNPHYVARVAYPFRLGGQILEAGVQLYSGNFVVTRGTGVGGGDEFLDRRYAMSVVLYPQPIGFQAEAVVGEGPELNAAQTLVERRPLEGAYVLVSWRLGPIQPFARWQYYRGGRKHETNSPANRTYETEVGVEWQPFPALELTAEYAFTDRTSSKAPYRNEYGRMARLQLQWNY